MKQSISGDRKQANTESASSVAFGAVAHPMQGKIDESPLQRMRKAALARLGDTPSPGIAGGTIAEHPSPVMANATPASEVMQAKITYNAKSKTFGKNAMRPGWLGALKTAFAGAKWLWKKTFGGSDVSHILSFDAIQDEIVHACANDDSSNIKGMLGRFFEDDDEIGTVSDLCDEMDGKSGAGKIAVANKILSKLNSSTQNTRHGHSSVNRGIGNRLDPEMEELSGGKYRLTEKARGIVDDAIDDRDGIRERRGSTVTARLRRTDSGLHFHSSDQRNPIPYGKVVASDRKKLLSLNDSDSDSDD